MNKGLELTAQGDVVTPWGIFLSGIMNRMRMVYPDAKRFQINFVPGDLPTTLAVSEGAVDIGLTTPPATASMAFNGLGPFHKKMTNLRAIGSFPHDDQMVWAVPADSGINSIEEMPDHPMRLAIPDGNYPVRFLVEKILEFYGISLDYLIERGWKIVEDCNCLTLPINVTEGRADAVIHEARMGQAWRDLAQKRPMKFLPIREDILQRLSSEYGFRRGLLKKGRLRGVDVDIPSVDFSEWLMFVREDMPFDVAYAITKIFIEKKNELFEIYFERAPPEYSGMTCPIDPRQVWRNVGIPLHPAAEKYYKEHGYMPAEQQEVLLTQ